MDDALEPYDGEQPGGEPGHPCQEEDGERDEAFPSGWVGEQRLHIDIRVRGTEVNFAWIATVRSDRSDAPQDKYYWRPSTIVVYVIKE